MLCISTSPPPSPGGLLGGRNVGASTQETTGTAVLLFHRFLIQERVGKHRRSRDVILTTCLFLAGKVTEAPRRLRDVINVLHMLNSTGQDEPPLLDKVHSLQR